MTAVHFAFLCSAGEAQGFEVKGVNHVCPVKLTFGHGRRRQSTKLGFVVESECRRFTKQSWGVLLLCGDRVRDEIHEEPAERIAWKTKPPGRMVLRLMCDPSIEIGSILSIVHPVALRSCLSSRFEKRCMNMLCSPR